MIHAIKSERLYNKRYSVSWNYTDLNGTMSVNTVELGDGATKNEFVRKLIEAQIENRIIINTKVKYIKAKR